MGKNRFKLTKTSEIWKKMGNPMPFEKVIGPNQHNMENYGDLKPIAQHMKPTLWVPSETFLSASSLSGGCAVLASHIISLSKGVQP